MMVYTIRLFFGIAIVVRYNHGSVVVILAKIVDSIPRVLFQRRILEIYTAKISDKIAPLYIPSNSSFNSLNKQQGSSFVWLNPRVTNSLFGELLSQTPKVINSE